MQHNSVTHPDEVEAGQSSLVGTGAGGSRRTTMAYTPQDSLFHLFDPSLVKSPQIVFPSCHCYVGGAAARSGQRNGCRKGGEMLLRGCVGTTTSWMCRLQGVDGRFVNPSSSTMRRTWSLKSRGHHVRSRGDLWTQVPRTCDIPRFRP